MQKIDKKNAVAALFAALTLGASAAFGSPVVFDFTGGPGPQTVGPEMAMS